MKIIFSDLDGTLLRHENEYGLATLNAVEQIQKHGILFVVTTGRLFSNAILHAKRLFVNEYDGYVISNNGALIYSFKDNKFIYQTIIPDLIVQKLLNFCLNYNVITHCYSDSTYFVTERTEDSAYWSKLMGTNYVVMSSNYRIKELITNMSINKKLNWKNKDWDLFYQQLVTTFPDLLFTKFGNSEVEVTLPNVSKGHALVFLTKYLNINLIDTMAFGDSWNDYTLLQMAGIGCAVGNAIPELKLVANEIVGSNHNDGPAQYLMKKLNLKVFK